MYGTRLRTFRQYDGDPCMVCQLWTIIREYFGIPQDRTDTFLTRSKATLRRPAGCQTVQRAVALALDEAPGVAGTDDAPGRYRGVCGGRFETT